MIDLSYLRQSAPAEYRIDAGDVLAVYVENVLGQRDQPPINQPVDNTRPPTLGYPLTVRDDGTLSLPLIAPIQVRGKTIPQIEQELRYAYTIQRRLLRPGQDRILVTLHQPRQYRILVVRQETQSDIISGVSVSSGTLGTAKKGTGHVVTLPAYRNDVLNALVESGGLPGLDAQNVIYVMRCRREGNASGRARSVQQLPATPGPYAQTYNSQPGQMPPPGGAMQPGYQSPGYQPPAAGGANAPLSPVPMRGPVQLPAPGYGPGTGQPSENRLVPGSSQILPPSGPVGHAGYAPIIRGQSPDSSNIQLTNYEVMATPRQVMEQVTGIPMPPRTEPTRLESAFNTLKRGNFIGAVTQAAFPPQYQSMNGAVVPAGCSTCQVGPNVQQPAMQYAPGMNIQSGPACAPQQQWRPPAAWGNAGNIARKGLWNDKSVTRIPLRLEPHEAVQFCEKDIVLEDGDIVFIASRDDELFYTGGLLGGGEYTLPRDRDLDILEAIAIAESNNNAGGQGGRSALNSDVSISPSQAVIVRQLPNDTQVPILVDLYRARTQPSERINIQPGDYIIVQYTKMEAVGAFIERHILESALFGVAAAQLSTSN